MLFLRMNIGGNPGRQRGSAGGQVAHGPTGTLPTPVNHSLSGRFVFYASAAAALALQAKPGAIRYSDSSSAIHTLTFPYVASEC